MPDPPFDNVEFSTEAEYSTPAEFIDIIHDPDVLYHYINDAHNKAQQDLTIDAGDNTEVVQTHAQVEVFQSAIQYVEAFGIYLVAYIKDRENLIEHLINTRPAEVTSFFEHLQNDSIETWLDENAIDGDWQTNLETLFGYAYIDDVEHPDDEELTDEELADIIDESTTVIDEELRSIGEFYTTFHDVYNAVKHGNRAIPETENEFRYTPHNDDTDTDTPSVALDMNFVLFVCKNEGEPYLTGLPIDYLLESALSTVEQTHSLFTHLKQISHGTITDEQFNISFFTRQRDTTHDETPDWMMAQHPSGIMIIPRTSETEPLLQEPHDWTFAARLELNPPNELIIRTRNTPDITDTYPIEITTTQTGVVGLTPQPLLELTLNFNLNDLDAIQYYELLKITETLESDDLDHITLQNEQADEQFSLGTPNNFPPIALDWKLEHDILEHIARLQQITQRHIPAPINVSHEQLDVIRKSLNEDLTRDDATDIVEELDAIGDEREQTDITIQQHNNDGQILDSTFIDAIPGSLSFNVRRNDTGEQPNFDNVESVHIPTEIRDISYDELIESLESDLSGIEDILDDLSYSSVWSHDTPHVSLRYETGTGGFWRTTHQLYLGVLAEEHRTE